MVPPAVLSKLRGNRSESYSSSTLPYDHTSLPPLQTPAHISKLERLSFPSVNRELSPGCRNMGSSNSPMDDSPAYRMTALPRFSEDCHQYRPSSATVERPGLNTSGTISSVASRAHNFVFSVQPPKKFTPSLTPNDSPMPSPNTGSAQIYGDRLHSKNVSTSSLSVVEDAASHKSGSSRLVKGKFNLLNPLSLLARRRSSQNQLPRTDEGNQSVNTLSMLNMPDDYDPRIRGKIVHDFSIPKARRFNSYTGVSSAETSPSVDSRPNTQDNRRGSEQLPPFSALTSRTQQSPAHSPLFKEHFNDERLPLDSQNKDYQCMLAISPVTRSANEPPRLPAFAKSLPLDIFGEDDGKKETELEIIDSNASVGKPHTTTQPPPGNISMPDSSRFQATSSISDPPLEKEAAPNPDLLMPLENLPKHMTSTSSRFSFQLSGIDSEAQERLLEEKHKQHAALRLLSVDDRADADSDEELYADADFNSDEGLEEKIPGINADLDEEVDENAQHQSLQSFASTSVTAKLSSDVLTTGLQPPPMDGEANTKVPQNPGLVPISLEHNSIEVLEQVPWLGSLHPTSLGEMGSSEWTGMEQQFPKQLEAALEDSDDIYYDDGNFENLMDMTDSESFDEEIFDDETGMIHDIPAQNARKLELAQEQNLGLVAEPLRLAQRTSSTGTGQTQPERSFLVSTDLDASINRISSEGRKEIEVSPEGQGNGLTEDNLAYQNALVSAANKAAAQGRFSRHVSISQDSEDVNSKSQIAESQPGLISDDSRISRFLDTAVAEDEPEDFVFDDEMEDDPMIAEANAEVLENDDEGFYGQEFGFYARAYGKGNVEMVNGGYFGPRGIEGVHRSHSAKAHFQEPSLTPITERSEWSHRNSIASLHTLGLPLSAQATANPGIAQLLDLDPLSFEDDISLSALLKLRRGAWGGSQTSLNSNGGSQIGGSPLAQPPLSDNAGSQTVGFEPGSLTGSDFLRHSYESAVTFAEDSDEERIHQTSTTTETPYGSRKKLSNESSQQTELGPSLHPRYLSQTSQATEKGTKGHSRASSGAESVSYIRDPEGSGRWLLERRRTGDDGELELVGREYVAGARI